MALSTSGIQAHLGLDKNTRVADLLKAEPRGLLQCPATVHIGFRDRGTELNPELFKDPAPCSRGSLFAVPEENH